MKRFIKILTLAAIVCPLLWGLTGCSSSSDSAAKPRESTKKERNFMKSGKKHYDKKRYADAEVDFKKALGENAANNRAKFNLASSYIQQRGEGSFQQDSLLMVADQMLDSTSTVIDDPELAELSFYDRGNLAYKAENYAAAIEMYKQALRRNPENNQARQNLRLAQLKKQEQDQNQDQNKDQQDQNKDQNQDQNKDQQDQQNPQDQQKQDQKQQQQQGGISQQNAAQILKAMDDKEAATRRKVEQMQKGEQRQGMKSQPAKPW